MTSCAICIQPIMFVAIAGIIHLTNLHTLKTTPVVPFVDTSEGADYLEPPKRLAWANDPVEGKDYSDNSFSPKLYRVNFPTRRQSVLRMPHGIFSTLI